MSALLMVLTTSLSRICGPTNIIFSCLCPDGQHRSWRLSLDSSFGFAMMPSCCCQLSYATCALHLHRSMRHESFHLVLKALKMPSRLMAGVSKKSPRPLSEHGSARKRVET